MGFIDFITNLQNTENKDLLETIQSGYKARFESMFKIELLEKLIKEQYGSYKDSDFEFVCIEKGGWNDEVIVYFQKRTDNPDLETLGDYAQRYAKRIGLTLDKIKYMDDGRIAVIFNRLSIIGC